MDDIRSANGKIAAFLKPDAVIALLCVVVAVVLGSCGEYIPPQHPLDYQAPVVRGVRPLNNSVGILPNAQIIVYFSETMDPATAHTGSVILYNSAGVRVPLAFDFPNGSWAMTLKPLASLSGGEKYYLTIYNSVSDLAGNRLESDFTSSFKIRQYNQDTEAPYVVRSNPEVAGQQVLPDSEGLYEFWVEFSEEISPGVVSDSTIYILDLRTGYKLPGVTTYSNIRDIDAPTGYRYRATIRPGAGVVKENQYIRMIVSRGVRDLSGNILQSVFFMDFNTVNPSTPGLTDLLLGDLDGDELIVCGEYDQLDSSVIKARKRGEVTILARFNQDMNLATLNSQSFFVIDMEQDRLVEGRVATFISNPRAARFILGEEPRYNSTYRVFVTEAIKSVSGFNLSPPYNTVIPTIDYDPSWMPLWNASVYNASEILPDDTGCAPPDR